MRRTHILSTANSCGGSDRIRSLNSDESNKIDYKCSCINGDIEIVSKRQ
jgi:hypothetical protein